MKLNEYVIERGKATELAKAMKVSPVLISQWASESRPVPAERCPQIEKATRGIVRCEDLRPDLAQEWAYLRGTKRKAA